LDEVHAIGGYGPTGAGVAEQLACARDISIIQGTLAKGVGLVGGYITGDANLVDAIRCNAAGFIFTVSLPPSVAAAARVSLDILARSPEIRERLRQNVALFFERARVAGIDTGASQSHIIPVMIGDSERCKQVSLDLLNEHGIYLQAINFPSVPKG